MSFVSVLVQVALLGEALVAARHWTSEWLLTRVDPEVVVEVVPLAKGHVATCEITFQYLEVARSFWVFELVDSKVISAGHVLTVLEMVQAGISYLFGACFVVKVQATRDDLDKHHVFRDLTENVFVLNLGTGDNLNPNLAFRLVLFLALCDCGLLDRSSWLAVYGGASVVVMLLAVNHSWS